MELNDLIRLQRQFDERHGKHFQWDEEVSEENLNMLKFIMISLTGKLGRWLV